ncbi:cation:proton antiporter [Micromonospora sp. WMMA1998]|uniref:cation:proton antiporter n=1 Tax=Micromonospora sp. WMMA1998 TaxID=3015167 RepID=UPI00248D1AE5|nr:cation:proton antiporter [Micromonospora sp. WMMA1998]WBC14942.1 cation:proton antiporter [Micromonospora sp. WMMA1998]
MKATELAMHFFLQLAVILGVCRVVGLLARRLGQPQVVGEMIAGVLLGPSLLGLLAPGVKDALFPSGPSMSILYVVGQVGLTLYMFCIGLEFDTGLIRHRARSATSVSLAGVLTPGLLGSALAVVLIGQQGQYFAADVSAGQAMLFMTAAIAITAFPMLARIISERRLSGTSLGTLALAAGATDDAISWCLLAVVLATFQQNALIAVLAIGGGLLYAVGMLTVGRRTLARLGPIAQRHEGVPQPLLAGVLTLLMASAWLTDYIGIYSVFGAFLLGVAMPRGLFAREVRRTLEPVVTGILLPLFFVFSGLNTQLGLVDSPELWAMTLLVVVVSMLGKGVACYLAARANREPHRDAFAIGSLMNARGLMELILLNIGLQAGLITPTLFTMLVLMAVLTTLMATPLFEFGYGRHRRRLATAADASQAGADLGPEPAPEAAVAARTSLS